MRNARPSGGRGRCLSKAFTLIELLAVVVIALLIVAMLMPAIAKARAKMQQVACINNLRQIYVALALYWKDNNGYLVRAGINGTTTCVPLTRPTWANALYAGKYLQNYDLLVCPGWGVPKQYATPTATGLFNGSFYTGDFDQRCDYGWNSSFPGTKDGTINTLTAKGKYAATIALTEGTIQGQLINLTFAAANPPTLSFSYYAQSIATPIHFGGYDYLFFDGHVAWMPLNEAAKTTVYWSP